MATLTEASIISKKVFKILIILLTISLALLIFLAFGKSIRDQIFPPETPPATVAFGKLPPMDLSGGYRPPQGLSFSIETVTGDLPSLQPFAKVFAIEPTRVQFGDVQRAKKSAESVGFTNEPVQIAPGKIKFTDPRNSQRTLTIDTSTGNFELESNWKTDLKIITSRIGNEVSAKDKARELLQAFGITKEEFPDQNLTLTKYRVDAGSLLEVSALSQANLIKVVLRRFDLDKLPVLPQKEDEYAIFALVSNQEVAAAEVTSYKVQRFKFATYPLKGVTKAFEDLRLLKAAFSNIDFAKNAATKLVIREVFLAYIENQNNTSYLQPAYVFKGSDFTAYVPAVADVWIAKESNP